MLPSALSRLMQQSPLAAVLWACRRDFAVSLLFTVVVNLLLLTPSLYMLQIYDRVMVSYSELTLLALSAVTLFLFALLAFAEWSRARLLVRLGVKLDTQLNARLFAASFQTRLRQQGGNATQAFADLAGLRQFLTGSSLFAFMDLPWTPIYLLVLFLLHPWLGLLGVIFMLMLAGLAWYSRRRTRGAVDQALAAGAAADQFLRSKLRNAEVIEAMGMLAHLRQRWRQRHARQLAFNRQAGDANARMQALSKFVRYSQQSLVLGAGALLVSQGELSPGAMIVASLLMGRATAPLDALVGAWKTFLAARQSFRRLNALLIEHERPRAAQECALALRGRVRLESLSAYAPGRIQPILDNLSADFSAGEVIGIVGPSGSGKSTLARALLGIWPYTTGQVLLDDEPVDQWDREALGVLVGYLPQDIELFDGTIAENVARFDSPDPRKVIRACQRAGVHEMVLHFPQGYDTPLGQAGRLLSGGQRQRLGLARALYGDPRLVVLDEPNSNLDDQGEAALARAIQDLKHQGSTVFLVSHRQGALGLTDRLLTLAEGAIVHDIRRNKTAGGSAGYPAAITAEI